MPKPSLLIVGKYQKMLLIALGSVPGALLRWHIDNDFIVNMLGAAILGFLLSISAKRSLNLILGFGFCGALTTFSSWILDAIQLIISGLILQAFGLIIYTFGFGLLGAIFGFWLGNNIKLIGPFR